MVTVFDVMGYTKENLSRTCSQEVMVTRMTFVSSPQQGALHTQTRLQIFHAHCQKSSEAYELDQEYPSDYVNGLANQDCMPLLSVDLTDHSHSLIHVRRAVALSVLQRGERVRPHSYHDARSDVETPNVRLSLRRTRRK